MKSHIQLSRALRRPSGPTQYRDEHAKAVAALGYVLHWARNPDPGSIFARNTVLRWVPDRALPKLLLILGYDGFLAFDDRRDEVLGHVFYQKHGDSFHVFSVFVPEESRGKGIALDMLNKFVEHVWYETPIRHVRLGANNNEAMKGLRGRLIEGATALPCRIFDQPLGWVHLQGLSHVAYAA